MNNLIEKYLPELGEGDNMATQAVTAVVKIEYKWFNDGDVFDNVHGDLLGWANDLSSYANWLAEYLPFTESTLMRIEDCHCDSDYEDLIEDLKGLVLNEKLLNRLEKNEKTGSIYDCDGYFEFKEYDYEDD